MSVHVQCDACHREFDKGYTVTAKIAEFMPDKTRLQEDYCDQCFHEAITDIIDIPLFQAAYIKRIGVFNGVECD